MKYTKDQRLDIGRRIYEGEISRFEAAAEYGIGWGACYLNCTGNRITSQQNMKAVRCSEGVLDSDFALHCSFHTLNCSSIT